MYDLPYHKEKDEQVVKVFIALYPFAFVSGCDAENKPVATARSRKGLQAYRKGYLIFRSQ